MRAVDTNVVVRYLAHDHPAQTAQAVRVIEGDGVFIAKTVLLEVERVMRSVYGLEPGHILDALTQLCGLPTVTVENPREVAFALQCAKRGLDFADALHSASIGGAESFVTFDADLIRQARRLGLSSIAAV